MPRASASIATFAPFPFAFAVALAVACSGGTKPAVSPVTATSSASSSSSAASKEDLRPICQRVCTVQTKCGGNLAACNGKCMPIARVLLPQVLEQMVVCVEQKASAKCGDSPEEIEARKHLVGACVLEATKGHDEQARANIALFAKAFCDRAQTCGSATGSFNVGECLGSAKGSILQTEGESSGGLYGSLRPSKLDEMIGCLGAPCEERKQEAADDLERCLDATLAKAAEQ